MDQVPNASVAPLVDSQASPLTRRLFTRLRELRGRAILFGHQNSTAYGVGWQDEPYRSDVKDACGDYPAVYGWDFGKQTREGEVFVASLMRLVCEAHARGGINTFSWHKFNPVTGGNFWDTKGQAVAAILPGGRLHEGYRAELARIAAFAGQARGIAGEPIPIVFRPFHEHTGDWFWWGRAHCTREEFIALWRFTVEHLRDELQVHNFLYCYSPDVFRDEAEYLERYPGDDYVDILGHDNYAHVKSAATRDEFLRCLRTIVELSDARGKIAALTETGLESISDPDWWWDGLWHPVRSDPVARRIAWFMVWRNADEKHHYAPNANHPSLQSFLRMKADPACWFEPQLRAYFRD